MMRQRWLAAAGFLASLLIAAAFGRADEAESVKVLEKAKATFILDDQKPEKPVVAVIMWGAGYNGGLLKELKELKSLQKSCASAAHGSRTTASRNCARSKPCRCWKFVAPKCPMPPSRISRQPCRNSNSDGRPPARLPSRRSRRRSDSWFCATSKCCRRSRQIRLVVVFAQIDGQNNPAVRGRRNRRGQFLWDRETGKGGSFTLPLPHSLNGLLRRREVAWILRHGSSSAC